MAKFQAELPNDLIKEFEKLHKDTPQMLEKMVTAGAEVVKNNIRKNINGKFKEPEKILEYLKVTRVYKTKSDDGINRKVAFYGYKPIKNGGTYKKKKKLKSGKTQTYEYEGVPVPLIVMAREFGTSRGEKKKPFVRKSFKKKDIEQAMMQVQDKYIKR